MGKYTEKGAEMKIAAMGALAMLVLAGCSPHGATKDEPVERGWVQRSVLQQPEHHVFGAVYDTTHVATEFLDLLRSGGDSIDVLVIFGTWCSDSHREVPRFLKIADSIGMTSERVRLYAVDRSKKDDDGLSARYHIERVPTFIFLKRGEEVGRITESPRTTMEGDMLTIFADAARAR
jgi:thiol-disulfide isomerase/thioredoxin